MQLYMVILVMDGISLLVGLVAFVVKAMGLATPHAPA
jgi:hypothetical protein